MILLKYKHFHVSQSSIPPSPDTMDKLKPRQKKYSNHDEVMVILLSNWGSSYFAAVRAAPHEQHAIPANGGKQFAGRIAGTATNAALVILHDGNTATR